MIKPYFQRPIAQYNLQGEYLKTFSSIVEAMKETGAIKCREVANGERQTSGGYIWKWTEEQPTIKKTGKPKKVAMIDKEGNLIEVFNSISEASRETGASISGIGAVCLGKQKTCFKHYWKFVEDDIV